MNTASGTPTPVRRARAWLAAQGTVGRVRSEWIVVAVATELLIGLLIARDWRPDSFLGFADSLRSGLLCGLGQWLVVRGRIRRAGWWPLVTMLGWGAAHSAYVAAMIAFPAALTGSVNTFGILLRVWPWGVVVGLLQLALLSFTLCRPPYRFIVAAAASWAMAWAGAVLATAVLQWPWIPLACTGCRPSASYSWQASAACPARCSTVRWPGASRARAAAA